MKEYLESVNKQVDELAARLRSLLSKNDRRKFSTVLVIDVHARDVIEVFVRERSVAHNLSVSYCKTDLLTLVVYIRKHSNRISLLQHFECSGIRMGNTTEVLLVETS
jgi:hypothetical protein